MSNVLPLLSSDAAAISETHRLGMAECGWRGLSELWVLKRLGDLHWQMIAQALGQDRAVFSDSAGRPVYAAFCAISLELDPRIAVAPGMMLTISSSLRRLSPTRLISLHDLRLDGRPLGFVQMISTFIRHGEAGGNRDILRAQPKGPLMLPAFEPDGGGGFAARAAALARTGGGWIEGNYPTHQMTPCPMTDFNAAGLLYCASYAALADRAEWALRPDLAPCALAAREIMYLGNIDPGEEVVAELAAGAGQHRLRLAADGRTLAVIATRKVEN